MVQEALASKISKTERAAGVLNMTISDVDKEIASLERNRKRLLSLVKQTEKKILINDERMKVWNP